jgi:hypothetical protein
VSKPSALIRRNKLAASRRVETTFDGVGPDRLLVLHLGDGLGVDEVDQSALRLASVSRQLRGERSLVGWPRFAARDVGGQVRKLVQNAR